MGAYTLFWLVVLLFVVGHGLLLESAWRLRRGGPSSSDGLAHSHGRADLTWSVITALLTGLLLYATYVRLG